MRELHAPCRTFADNYNSGLHKELKSCAYKNASGLPPRRQHQEDFGGRREPPEYVVLPRWRYGLRRMRLLHSFVLSRVDHHSAQTGLPL